jgi:hypothetical protein
LDDIVFLVDSADINPGILDDYLSFLSGLALLCEAFPECFQDHAYLRFLLVVVGQQEDTPDSNMVDLAVLVHCFLSSEGDSF